MARLPDSSDSEDDRPLATTANGHAKSNGSNVNGKRPLPSSSSELTDDDKPLVYSSDEDDDKPIAQMTKSIAVPMPGAVEKSGVEDDVPLAKANGRASRGGRRQSYKEEDYGDEDEDDSDEPIAKRAAKKRTSTGKGKQPPKKRVKKGPDADASSDEDIPLAKHKAAKSKAAPKPTEKKRKSEPATPSAQNGRAQVKKEESVSPVKPRGKTAKSEEADAEAQAKAEEEAEEEESYKYWEKLNAEGDGSQKWSTLEHNGVLFPPPYQPLPSHVKMLYDGKVVELPHESEEVAGFFGAMLETPHAQDNQFRNNFFEDFQAVLSKYPPRNGIKIKSLDACDFRPMYEHFEAERAKKKAMSTAEKKETKKVKDALEEPYLYCMLDGRKEKVGNFRVEPPGLFRGRGEHPRKGRLKLRLHPEDMIINIGEGSKIPVPNIPGKWKEVIHDNTVTWLANWKENINGNSKYVFLAAGSSLKGQSDIAKFEKARELKKHVDRLRKDYTADLGSKVMAERQRATAIYFIDRYALRAGNEKGDEEADTVGCCSLRYEHVTMEKPDKLILDFLGKDSIRYYNELKVEPQIFKNVRIFKEGKSEGDDLFDRVTTASLNKYLQSYMKGLTAKVFRTYNASITCQQLLEKLTDPNATVAEKILSFNRANRELRALKYQRRKLRLALLTQEPQLKKKKKELLEEESDLDDEWIANHEDELRKKDIEKAEKKFEKEKEKAAADGEDEPKASVLEGRLETINEEYDRLKKERGTKTAELKTAKSSEKIEEAIEKLDERIKNFRYQMTDREEGKEVSLTTSKTNYIDPRIIAAWAKKHEVPIEKVLPKSLITKFPWAVEVDADYIF
ncbi:topoisomerase I [Dacryopinax primogenitus]|uniref:DNA topoisomerase I n=1 Tax=Dacryopinax primogenitus (strain DJM 731) TaxID=1858805 RepID=M5GFM6_DACPD|nr:topoisomerase I [Dacryopinax primogenitus]EJU04243.1 topoisomerase I [Dacryopinax primogenitus]